MLTIENGKAAGRLIMFDSITRQDQAGQAIREVQVKKRAGTATQADEDIVTRAEVEVADAQRDVQLGAGILKLVNDTISQIINNALSSVKG